MPTGELPRPMSHCASLCCLYTEKLGGGLGCTWSLRESERKSCATSHGTHASTSARVARDSGADRRRCQIVLEPCRLNRDTCRCSTRGMVTHQSSASCRSAAAAALDLPLTTRSPSGNLAALACRHPSSNLTTAIDHRCCSSFSWWSSSMLMTWSRADRAGGGGALSRASMVPSNSSVLTEHGGYAASSG